MDKLLPRVLHTNTSLIGWSCNQITFSSTHLLAGPSSERSCLPSTSHLKGGVWSADDGLPSLMRWSFRVPWLETQARTFGRKQKIHACLYSSERHALTALSSVRKAVTISQKFQQCYMNLIIQCTLQLRTCNVSLTCQYALPHTWHLPNVSLDAQWTVWEGCEGGQRCDGAHSWMPRTPRRDCLRSSYLIPVPREPCQPTLQGRCEIGQRSLTWISISYSTDENEQITQES